MINLDPSGSIQPLNSGEVSRGTVTSPEEAAKQFEAILMRQFVSVMTKGLFEESLAGDEGPGWIKGQQDTQRDVMTEVLTQHLVESGALRISDLLLRQWRGSQAVDAAEPREQEES